VVVQRNRNSRRHRLLAHVRRPVAQTQPGCVGHAQRQEVAQTQPGCVGHAQRQEVAQTQPGCVGHAQRQVAQTQPGCVRLHEGVGAGVVERERDVH
jgi:hypothetical protein